jgi:hypothetical protein
MTLPIVPGNSMSFSQINTELGLSSTATISLNDAAVRTLAGVGASPATIAITNLSGKSNQFAFTISSNTTNANLRTLAVNAGWPGTAKVVATINSGIFVSSTSTGTPALTINGSFPGGVSLINNGTIQGQGGGGGNGGSASGQNGFAGSAGGLALSVSVAVTITNNNRIAGGGGGGGGGAGSEFSVGKSTTQINGSGGGGGLGGTGGSGGAKGPAGFGTQGTNGTAGTQTTNGGGGQTGIFGGAGGSYGAAGSSGNSSTQGTPRAGGSGGAAGGCITGNSNITYLATGTRNGGIS